MDSLERRSVIFFLTTKKWTVKLDKICNTSKCKITAPAHLFDYWVFQSYVSCRY